MTKQSLTTKVELNHVKAISMITVESFIKTYLDEENGITNEIITKTVGSQEALANAYIKKIQLGKNKLSFIYIENSTVLGHIWGKEISENNYMIETLYVDLKHVKKGIGGKLMKALLNQISEISPLAKITIVVAKTNLNTIQFYEHFGFKIVNPNYGKYKLSNELFLDTVEMSN
jgi:ribosomal protein S18 acetylase RimI-like enzyme